MYRYSQPMSRVLREFFGDYSIFFHGWWTLTAVWTAKDAFHGTYLSRK